MCSARLDPTEKCVLMKYNPCQQQWECCGSNPNQRYPHRGTGLNWSLFELLHVAHWCKQVGSYAAQYRAEVQCTCWCYWSRINCCRQVAVSYSDHHQQAPLWKWVQLGGTPGMASPTEEAKAAVSCQTIWGNQIPLLVGSTKNSTDPKVLCSNLHMY